MAEGMTYADKLRDAVLPASGIYAIKIADGMYVGSALYFRTRILQHLNHLLAGTHPNRHLLSAFRKYGEFDFEVLECVTDPARLVEREQYFMDALSPRYNIAPRAGSRLGLRHTAESRAKMSISNKGRPCPEFRKAELRAQNLGMKLTPEQKRKVSLSKMGDKNAASKSGVLYDATTDGSYPFYSLASICAALGLNYSSVSSAFHKEKFYLDRYFVSRADLPKGRRYPGASILEVSNAA